MKLLSDLHTHTIASGHAYTTLMENINYCAENGIKILGTSDHGPSMPGAPHVWNISNLRVVPRTVNGVIVLKGCEANILDTEGTLDISKKVSDYIDYLIASFHEPVFPPCSLKENMSSMLNAIDKNEKVEILGHLGNPIFDLDYETIVEKAKEKDIMIEINNTSLLGDTRIGSESNCRYIAELCKKHNTKIIVTSDAHISFSIGQFDKAIEMLESINFPEELIMNDPSKLIAHLKNKGRLTDL